ncbi:Uncharacterised protein [Klebsiella variicola]|nr:Uncharacterised protein [Klebsiella variicola]
MSLAELSVSFFSANSRRLAFCACTSTGPSPDFRLSWPVRAKSPSFSPASAVMLPMTPALISSPALMATFFVAVICRCSPLVSAMPSGAEKSTASLSGFSLCSNIRIWLSTSAFRACACSAAISSCCSCWLSRSISFSAAFLSSASPCALGCVSALTNSPLPARIVPHSSVRSSVPWPRRCPCASTRCPLLSCVLPYSVASLICSSPRLSSIRSLLFAGVRSTLRV